MSQFVSFHQLFSNLISELKASDKVVEVSSNFGPQESIESMFSYLWDLEEAHQCLSPMLNKSAKSDVESDRLRSEGNKCYQKKFLDKALKLYNLCITSATHPPLSKRTEQQEIGETEMINSPEQNGCVEEEYRSLSLGYANRSAILLELEQFEKCICDIDSALVHGYPKLLHSKLAQRKAKCLLALHKRSEAQKVLQDSLKALDKLSLDENKSKTSRETLQSLLQSCEEEDNQEKLIEEPPEDNYVEGPLTDVSKEKLLFAYRTPLPPKLVEPNLTIPSLSRAVQLAYTPDQGRYLVATRDIQLGEIVVVEEGYCSILELDSSLRTHCSTCLARCLTPLPCPSCTKVIFCSDSCRHQGIQSFHQWECNVLPTLAALDMGRNSVLGFRILTQTTYAKLKAIIQELSQETDQKPPESLGFNSQGLYDSSDYRAIYHLVHNKDQRTVSDLFKRCAMAFTLTKLLVEGQKYFVGDGGEPLQPQREDILLVGCTMFIHMMNLPCNAHSITELQVNVSSYQASASQEIGSGAFGVLSLTNHSCNPATARSSYKGINVLRAIRFIPNGAEVTDSYGEHYGIRGGNERREELLQQYCFNCTCEACKGNWPTYPSLSSSLPLRCLRCSEALNSKGKCKKCGTDKHNKETGDKVYNYKMVGEQVKNSVTKHPSIYESIISGNNTEENRTSVCNFLGLVDKYVKHPCKLYFEAQETLKHCFDRQGSCVFRKEDGDVAALFKGKH